MTVRTNPRRIVCGIDASDEARDVARVAARLARALDQELVLVCAGTHPSAARRATEMPALLEQESDRTARKHVDLQGGWIPPGATSRVPALATGEPCRDGVARRGAWGWSHPTGMEGARDCPASPVRPPSGQDDGTANGAVHR